MVDRENRNKFAKALKAYMAEEMTAFALDEELSGIRTGDETLEYGIGILWYFYDDCTDHKVVGTKDDWSYFNRLLLFLESDAELEFHKSYHWEMPQSAAGISLVCNIVILCLFIFGRCGIETLAVATFLLWCVAMALCWHRKRRTDRSSDYNPATTPFPNYRSLAFIRRNQLGFLKRKYPDKLKDRKIRAYDIALPGWMAYPFVWLAGFIFLPFFLAILAIPFIDRETTVELRGRNSENAYS